MSYNRLSKWMVLTDFFPSHRHQVDVSAASVSLVVLGRQVDRPSSEVGPPAPLTANRVSSFPCRLFHISELPALNRNGGFEPPLCRVPSPTRVA
jgi:hypothetical protein